MDEAKTNLSMANFGQLVAIYINFYEDKCR